MVVVDMDCTLYSYSELALSQRAHVISLFYSLLKDSNLLYANADKVFLKYSSHIKERINFLIQFFGQDNVFFYSSYPITDFKLKSLSNFKVLFHSSFPHKKTAKEVSKFCNKKIHLVIGDREIDKKLAKDLKSEWRGYPYYNYRHLLSGKTYTNSFISLVTSNPYINQQTT